ncbi:MAG: bifunctional biotin--[acetyl-CoA-carboxylase] ligase/biotin operon repressor BirA [Gammaproteobacteria bacterium]|nr:bifunctional biotin--[acetyl-CoA-carboxylase] ligase/biotin operon repressor BirA [Gammaproteobacteria bacterium]
MDTRQKLIHALADGRFHSGEMLADSCGISRTAVWKHLSHIKTQLGIDIYSVRGKGYQLAQEMDLLDQAAIEKQMSASALTQISELEILGQIDSTNSYLMSRTADEIESGHVCLAEQQTAGRGRQGRVWISPYGNNIYLSIFWRFSLDLAGLSGLSLAAGVIVAKTLNGLGVTDIGLKWPNDILWHNRKLAGLLIEVRGEQGGPSNVVLGLGLNSRLSSIQGDSIDQPWTDLATVTEGGAISRNLLAAKLIETLLAGLNEFQKSGFAFLVNDWNRYDLHQGKTVSLQVGTTRIEGVHRGVESSGALLVEVEGKTKAYHGGELSLRAMEGVR